jgi:hypothetical protein
VGKVSLPAIAAMAIMALPELKNLTDQPSAGEPSQQPGSDG